MSTQIDIVIRGSDLFSQVFDALARVLEQSSQAALQLQSGTEAAAQGLQSMTAEAARAGEGARAMTAELVQQLHAAAEAQRQTLQQIGQQQQEAEASLAEQRLALQIDADAQFQDESDRARDVELQATQTHIGILDRITSAGLISMAAFEADILKARLESYLSFSKSIQALAASQGRALAQAAKNLAIAEALISTYLAANKALASVPYPFNFAAAALVVAEGMANVRSIQQTQIAHGGLDNVPEDATFLLRRGERVLSPAQNRDLTDFLSSAGGPGAPAPVTIQQLTVHVLEHATSGEALLAMSPAALQEVVAEKIIPALDALARLGVRPKFIGNNT